SGTIQLTATPSGGSWSANAPNGLLNSSALGAGVQTISYSYTNTNGCSNSTNTLININPSPVVAITSSFNPICSGSGPITFTATPAGGVWSGSNVDTLGVLNPNAIGAGTYNVSYTYTNSNGCASTATTAIIVNAAPTTTIAPISNPVCNNNVLINLVATPSGGTWSPNAPGGVFNPSVLGVGTHNITYGYIDSSGCINSTILQVSVVLSIPLSLAAQNTCANTQNGTISVLNPNIGNTYLWNTGQTTASINNLGAGTYIITATDPNGCTAQATTSLQVYPPTTTIVTASATTVTLGQPVTLTATGAASYLWSNGATGSILTLNPSQTITYSVTGTDANGCTSISTITINTIVATNDNVSIHQALLYNTPNPYTQQTTIHATVPLAQRYTLQVFSMTGQKVFEKNYVLQEGENIILFETQALSAGNYFYKFKELPTVSKMLVE
ncbi:MAG: hypothetical protein RLZZ292_1294, partial [Bacteroidota bacterium]